jgi:hypothetical protein
MKAFHLFCFAGSPISALLRLLFVKKKKKRAVSLSRAGISREAGVMTRGGGGGTSLSRRESSPFNLQVLLSLSIPEYCYTTTQQYYVYIRVKSNARTYELAI